MSVVGSVFRGLGKRWIDRRLGAPGRRTRLAYRRIFILPSRSGLLFSALLVVIWLGAVNYSNSMAFLLCFLLLGISMLAMVHTFRNLAGLRLQAEPPRPVFAGEEAQFPIRLDNPDRRERAALALRLPDQPAVLVDVPPGSDTRAHVTVHAPRRGWQPLDRCVIETRFPTGLFTAWSWLRLETRCLVYPAPEPGPIPPPQGTGPASGDRTSREGDDDFHGLRRYQPGDSLRQVAWRTLARGQELQTKQFAGNARQGIWLDWDCLSELGVEQRLSRLCRWVLDAENARRPYGLRLPGQRVAPGLGPDHRDRCLRALALFPA
ncbi:MAG: DUF58 domain-containing protein [Ectothiorhodospiraceae bacterium]|nr:DUF58 domain-containing protein [Ectothiorhodospiraceae bacterium]